MIYCLIVKSHFKRPSLCDYQFIIIRIQFYETRTSSCHTFKEAKANGGSPQLSSPFYSQIIVTFRRVGGDLVMKLTHKGDLERPVKVPGVWRTTCYTSESLDAHRRFACIANRAKLHSSIKSVCLNFKTVIARRTSYNLSAVTYPQTIYYLTYNSYHSNN